MSLRVFLCHASQDKQAVRQLYTRLRESGYHPWLDEEDLLPGQDWALEIRAAVRRSDVVAVCLSRQSIQKSGFVQKEIGFALDVADEQPEGTIFLIPVRLEECAVPSRLARWHWVDLFEDNGYDRLVRSLEHRLASHSARIEDGEDEAVVQPILARGDDIDLLFEDDRDRLFREAALICILHQGGSASLLHRRLRIGYGRAARIIDQLHFAGVLGPPDGSKPRDVLIDIADLDQIAPEG